MSTRPLIGSQRWRRLIPLAFVTYSLAYVDRSNYSLGAAGGLTHSLHITSGQVGLLGGLFFIGYFVFQVPAAEFAERRSVKRLMFWSLILWGIFAALQGVRSFPLLLAARFALGVVEAAAIPAMLVFLTHSRPQALPAEQVSRSKAKAAAEALAVVWSVPGPVGSTRTRVSPAQRQMENPLTDVSDKPRWPGPKFLKNPLAFGQGQECWCEHQQVHAMAAGI